MGGNIAQKWKKWVTRLARLSTWMNIHLLNIRLCHKRMRNRRLYKSWPERLRIPRRERHRGIHQLRINTSSKWKMKSRNPTMEAVIKGNTTWNPQTPEVREYRKNNQE